MKIFIIVNWLLMSVCFGWVESAVAAEQPAAIVTSFYPMQVFTLNVTRGIEALQPSLLLPATLGCPHDYGLTPGDAAKLSAAQALIMNGQMEGFLTVATLKELNPGLTVIVSGKAVSDLPEKNAEHGAFNPHSWVSPFAAAQQVRVISAELSAKYPEYAAQLTANGEEYATRLVSLGDDMKRDIAALSNRKIITFHDAFAYFARDLGLEVVGVIEIEPGTPPGPKHLQAIIELTKAQGVKAIFAEAQYPSDIADVVAKEAGVKLLTLDPAASAASESLTMYEDVMRKNLATLKDALQ